MLDFVILGKGNVRRQQEKDVRRNIQGGRQRQMSQSKNSLFIVKF